MVRLIKLHSFRVKVVQVAKCLEGDDWSLYLSVYVQQSVQATICQEHNHDMRSWLMVDMNSRRQGRQRETYVAVDQVKDHMSCSIRAARKRMSTYQCQQFSSFIFASCTSLTVRRQGYDNFGTFHASALHSHLYLMDVILVSMSEAWLGLPLPDSSRTSLTKRSDASHMTVQNGFCGILVHNTLRTYRHSE